MPQCPPRIADDAVAALAARIEESGVEVSPGEIVWIRPQSLGTENLRPLAPNLYDGSSGIALFLAALYRQTGNGPWGDLALAAMAPLRRQLQQLAADPARASRLQLALGGWMGLGSFLYCMARVGRDLGEEGLLEEALESLNLLTPERIAADRRLDLMTGSAGALLAGLALWRETDDARALEAARLCGERLLGARVSWQGRPRAWPGTDRPPLSGFAHGAAGIAYALVRLYGATGDSRFLEAALEGFAFERSLFDRNDPGWLDPRTGKLVEQAAWCHGAPGIALSRAAVLGMSQSLGLDGLPAAEASLSEDLESALALTRNIPELPLDHLCCGNAGQIEILTYLGETLNRPELGAEAEALAAKILVADEGRLEFRLRGPDLSLFNGLAGVAGSLMSLNPDAAPRPSWLLLEASPHRSETQDER